MKPVSKQVASISFSLVSPEEIKKIAVAKIVTAELYDVDGYPIDGGLMDLRLGAIDPGVRCRTCGGRLKECMGHFGYIELARPILHIKYVPLIELLLRCCCKKCGKLLAQGKTPAETIKKAKDTKKCVFCNAEQGKIKVERPYTFFLNKKRIFPSEIREMLTRINNEDYGSLGFNSNIRPEWAILTMLLFPPVTTRPSITLETGERSEDDLTHKLGDVLRSNQRLWENLNAGAPEVIIEDLWDLVQYHITTYIDNSIAQIPPARLRSGQLLESISERIKGKEGRIRHNLAGKRVNFSSRAVISPDPYIKFDEVGIPFDIASVLTVPEKVNNTNMEEMKRLIISDSYPKANYIIRPDGKRKRITQELKQEILDELQEGYTVERTVVDGDIVLFNRHPSLHRLSLMAHRARILDGKTFRLHPAVTFPYNADFDGDEMNVHIPQTEEARAEAKVLLHVNKHLMTPKNNSNVYGCIADALTGNYILSKKILEKKDAVQLLVEAGIEEEKIKKAILRQKVSGKEILSALLPKIDFGMRTKACLGRECKHFDSCMKEKCKNNAYLSIKKGEMIAGVLDKNSVGVEDGLLIKEIDKKGREETMHFLSSLFKLGTIFLTKTGLSIGIEDVRISESEEITKKIIENAEKKVFEIIGLYKNNTLELIPGKNAEETREIKILQILNAIRSEIGVEIKKRLREENPVSLMAKSGAGGNILYITQMSCSVGQQALWGKRIELGYKDRTLSFFKRNELSPLSRGFIYSNYVGGLKEHEFFFGAITGRDSLMDTALRTPKSGYFYRRISNALQDLKIEYDSTVRDASGRVVQFVYGDDGIDASAVHLQEKIAPGEAIGIITAQSFGEPSTQMTLNVFHFAGVSEMQVAMGLPRLLEIFDARKKPSTPAMEIYLRENNEQKAKEIARKIKQIRLKEVVREIVIDFANKNIEIFFDMKSLREAFLHIQEIAGKLKGKEASIKSKEKEISIRIKKDSIVIKTEADYKQLYKIKEKIKETIIGGVKGIEQVLPVKREKEYVVITSGSNLEEIFKIKGVNSERTTTNDITEIASVLGIEAARRAVIEETKKVMEKQGIDIDERHIKLVADAMTQNGGLKGITRVGIISEKSSILARASFETPIKHFVNASLLNAKDELKSVIENIILNQPVPVGTGLPGLLVKITGKLAR